jgi:hypothetical protein
VSADELLSQSIYLGHVPLGANFINLNFHNDNSGYTGGAVMIYVYDDVDTAKDVYQTTSRVVEDHHNLLGMLGFEPPVGAEAVGGSDTPQKHLTFRRCRAVVYIWMVRVTEDQIVAYAQRLDGRLAGLVCRIDD